MILTIILLNIFALNVNNSTAGEKNQKQALNEKYGEEVKIKHDKSVGQTLIWGLKTKASEKKAEEIAADFLAENAKSLKTDLKNLKLKDCSEYGGVKHVYFDQYYRELPVHGKEVHVHIRNNGEVDSLDSRYCELSDIDINPAVTAEAAAQTVMKDLGIKELSIKQTSFDDEGIAKNDFLPVTPELIILPQEEGDARLSWKFTFTVEEPYDSWCYLVDAKSGEIIDKFSLLQGYTTGGSIKGYTILTDPVVTPPLLRALPYAQARTYYYNYGWKFSTAANANSSGNYSMSYSNGYTWYHYQGLTLSNKCQGASEYIGGIPGLNSPAYHPYYGLPYTYNFEFNEDPYLYYSRSDCANLCYHITNSLTNYYQNTHSFSLGYNIIAWAHWLDVPNDAKYDLVTKSLYFGAGDDFIANNGARARDCILHELQHAVTDKIYNPYNPNQLDPHTYRVLAEAYSDYFACTQTNDPLFAEWWSKNPAKVRNHANYYGFPQHWTGSDPYIDMLVPGSTFWQIRSDSEIGQVNADRVILGSIYYEPLSLSGLRLACELVAANLLLPPATQAAISNAFVNHGI